MKIKSINKEVRERAIYRIASILNGRFNHEYIVCDFNDGRDIPQFYIGVATTIYNTVIKTLGGG